jgi:hypothetical protein
MVISTATVAARMTIGQPATGKCNNVRTCLVMSEQVEQHRNGLRGRRDGHDLKKLVEPIGWSPV